MFSLELMMACLCHPHIMNPDSRTRSRDSAPGESRLHEEGREADAGREGWLGDYDFKYLCMPTMPFGKGKGRRKPPPFYSLNADLPMLLALVCGELPLFWRYTG
jgi:hypothetical protein